MLHALQRTAGMSVRLLDDKFFRSDLVDLSLPFGSGKDPQSARHIGQQTGFF